MTKLVVSAKPALCDTPINVPIAHEIPMSVVFDYFLIPQKVYIYQKIIDIWRENT
jgi:hypothetical protein